MYALKVHVERIVRPIRASVQRKNQIREELLAHLIAGFNDERKETESDEEAIAKVIERLGAVESVRHDFESTVPKLERIGCIRILPGMDDVLRNEKRPNESAGRYGMRTATYITAFAAPFALLTATGLVIEDFLKGIAWTQAMIQFVEYIPVLLCSLASLWVAFAVSNAFFERTGMCARCSPSSSTPAITKACLSTTFWFVPLVLFLGMVLPIADVVAPDDGGLSPTNTMIKCVGMVPLYAWILLPGIFVFSMIPPLAFE